MDRKRIVVLGTGFGSFSLVRRLDLRRWDLTVVSPRNHFLFTPLLPSSTVGTVEFRSIIEPVRNVRDGFRFYQATCLGVDAEGKTVQCRGEEDGRPFVLAYDVLVIGVGAAVSTFGVPGVLEHATVLKEANDARQIRQGIIDCFERASRPDVTEVERRRWLHFVVVGGGPTGVEFAAELHDFLMSSLKRAYPTVWDDVRITLLEAGTHILTSFDATLSDYAARLFKRQRIEVRAGSLVTRVEKGTVHLKGGETLSFGLMVWSAGVGPRELLGTLQFAKDGSGRIITDGHLHVLGRTDVYAIGDCSVEHERELPMTAQVAMQQGNYLASALNLPEGRSPRSFAYHHYGMLAYVGSHRALADLSAVKGRGFATFLFWRSAYLTRLVSFKNKVLVIFDWLKTLVFGRDISRF